MVWRPISCPRPQHENSPVVTITVRRCHCSPERRGWEDGWDTVDRSFGLGFCLLVCLLSIYLFMEGNFQKLFGSEFSLPTRPWGLNSGHQPWKQAPLPAEPSCWPVARCFEEPHSSILYFPTLTPPKPDSQILHSKHCEQRGWESWERHQYAASYMTKAEHWCREQRHWESVPGPLQYRKQLGPEPSYTPVQSYLGLRHRWGLEMSTWVQGKFKFLPSLPSPRLMEKEKIICSSQSSSPISL